MDFRSLVDSVMEAFTRETDDPFLIYRDENGGWDMRYTGTESGEAADWVKDAMEADPLAIEWTAGDFIEDDYSRIFDCIIMARIRAECYNFPGTDKDTAKRRALISMLDDKFGGFSQRTKDYLITLDRPLAELEKICPFDMRHKKWASGYNKNLAKDALEYIENAVYERIIIAEHTKPERVIEGYTETLCIPFAGRETVLAENQNADQPYLVCSVKWDNPLGIEERYDGIVTDDYTEAMREFVRRVDSLAEALETGRREAGLAVHKLTAAGCVPGGRNEGWEGKVLILKPEKLSPEYRSAEHQLVVCTGGFGARPDANGRKVYVEELYSGKQCYYQRQNIAGIADPSKLPEWAKTKLALRGASARPREMSYTERGLSIEK